MIELKDLELTVGTGTVLERRILNRINIKIKEGEFVTVIGTNGAGKSSLLNVIAGECRSSGGQIKIDETDVTGMNSYQRSHWIARVFQDPLVGSCGELTVAENMALTLRRGKSRGMKKAIDLVVRSRFRHELAKANLGLENRLDMPMNSLSGGQRQAVCLVTSALSPMKILLLDEHTSALDPKTAEKMMKLTEQIVRENQLTALMVTHSLAHALNYGTRTLLLHEGRVARELFGLERSQLDVHALLDLYDTAV